MVGPIEALPHLFPTVLASELWEMESHVFLGP